MKHTDKYTSCIIGLTFLLIPFFMDCATTPIYMFNLMPSPDKTNMETYYKEGKELIISHGKETDVILYGFKDTKNLMFFKILLINKLDDKSVCILPETIRVLGLGIESPYCEFKVFSASEYVYLNMKAQNQALLAYAIAGIMGSNYPTSTTVTSAIVDVKSETEVYDNYQRSTGTYEGSSKVDVKAKTETYDNYQRSKDTYEGVSKLSENYRNFNTTTYSSYLKKHTLFPRTNYEGQIAVQVPNKIYANYIVFIPIGEDKHRIIFIPNIL